MLLTVRMIQEPFQMHSRSCCAHPRRSDLRFSLTQFQYYDIKTYFQYTKYSNYKFHIARNLKRIRTRGIKQNKKVAWHTRAQPEEFSLKKNPITSHFFNYIPMHTNPVADSPENAVGCRKRRENRGKVLWCKEDTNSVLPVAICTWLYPLTASGH